MIIYNYNYKGEYLYSSEADESPLEAGVYLIPSYATTVVPPSVDSNHIQVWNGSAWGVLVKDSVADSSTVGYKTTTDNSPTIDTTGITMSTIANTSSTTVTLLSNGYIGQEITLIFLNANTIIQSNSVIKLSGTNNFTSANNSVLKLICIGDLWLEVSRSVNS